jgi:hypothetical protein
LQGLVKACQQPRALKATTHCIASKFMTSSVRRNDVSWMTLLLDLAGDSAPQWMYDGAAPTPYHRAAFAGRIGILNLFAERGGDSTRQFDDGRATVADILRLDQTPIGGSFGQA